MHSKTLSFKSLTRTQTMSLDKNFSFNFFMSSGNKKEKASDFMKSEAILRDVLFGARKSNVTDETR